MRRVPFVVLAVLAAGLIVFGEAYGYLRTAVGLALGGGILYLGLSYFRAAGQIPPDPEAEDVSADELKYVCSMCGLELKIEVVTSHKPPTHCREPMVLVRGGSPPLRPVT